MTAFDTETMLTQNLWQQ